MKLIKAKIDLHGALWDNVTVVSWMKREAIFTPQALKTLQPQIDSFLFSVENRNG